MTSILTSKATNGTVAVAATRPSTVSEANLDDLIWHWGSSAALLGYWFVRLDIELQTGRPPIGREEVITISYQASTSIDNYPFVKYSVIEKLPAHRAQSAYESTVHRMLLARFGKRVLSSSSYS
jgi:hypothetical protein